ncbi:Protein 21.1 [Giardia duodenalis assemblage B]|uniref:Protein 21.1 n=1 Tax=Giardia duodenalis assemblage B TaxID=1394984 RepID=A0A132NXJ9_GIAIN|nr:Protein 21.1 [Giardia intestinalis assemblage B]
MPADSPRPAAVTLGVPTFTPAELHKQLDAVLGKGASGTVYSLRDFPGLAAKEILLDGLDQRSIDAAKLELATLPALSHPGILRYHQVIEDDSFIYIVMDRHDGTLECLLIEHKRKKTHVSNRLVCSIARQIAGALAYLCNASGVDAKGEPFRGLVHRDLKPVNILVAADGEQFILADFGLCKDALRSGTTLAGTKPYMAPETLLYNSTSPASDIWSLGVIIYELATLKRPNFLEGREPKDVFIDGWKPDLSDMKNDFIRGILERIFVLDPKKRPTAKELADIFQTPSTSYEGHSPHTTAWEAALDNANARIAALERERSIMSAEINTLKSTIAAQATEMSALRKELEALKLANEHVSKHDEQASRVKETLALEAIDDRGVTTLMKAATRNDVEAVKALVTKQKKLRNSDGRTALMHAAESGSTDALRILLEYEKGMRDNQDHNALYHALKNGHTEAAKVIVPHEDPTDGSGITALMRAAVRGDIEAVRLLIPLQKEMRDNDGNTALVRALKNRHEGTAMLLHRYEALSWTSLMRAAAAGDIEAAKQHLSDKDKKNEDGDTALMIAARADHENIVELLDPTDENGVTALMRATIKGDVETARALMHLQKRRAAKCVMINGRSASHGTALMMAAACGHADVVELLVEYEGGMKDTTGQTALMFAALNGHRECVKLLLEETCMQDNDGVTALMYAAQQGHEKVVKVLLEHEKGIVDNKGNTAFMHALKNKYEDIALLLREFEAPSWTPLMCAAFTGDIELVKQYLSDKDTRNIDGDTALILAARAGHGDIVELLDPTDKDGVTVLMRAAEEGDVKAVKALVSGQKKLRDSNGKTALMHAAQRGCKEAIEVLLEHEKGIRDNQNHNALYHALKTGHMEVVGVLIEDDDPTDENGVTALMRAADRGDTEMVELLAPLQKGLKDGDGCTAFIHALANKCTNTALLLRESEAPSWTPLMHAAASGDIETARQHLSDKDKKNDDGDNAYALASKAGQGAILELLDPTDENGVTALMRAAERGDVKAVRALIPLQKGRTAGYVMINGWRISHGTALMRAAAYGHAEVVNLLVEKEEGMQDKDGVTALMCAAWSGHAECAKLLLEKEGGMKTNYGWTALMGAAKNGHTECVRLLLNKEGGMHDIPDLTALMWAALNGHRECVKLLLKKEWGVQTSGGWTALMHAAQNGHADCVKLLLEKEVGMQNKDGWSALMRAAARGHKQVVELLTEEGGLKNNDHQTALMWVACNCHSELVKLLLEKEGGVQDKDGETALMKAAGVGRLDCAKLLLEKEAGLQDRNGWTALMHAVRWNRLECARFLAEREKDMKTIRERFGCPPGTTALDVAKKMGRTEIVSILSE